MLNRGSRGRFRPGMPRLGVARPDGFSSEPRPEDSFEPSSTVPRRLPASPIYKGGGPYERKIVKPPPPKLLRDRLYDRMCDWSFHGLADFESWMPEHQWITAMCDLVDKGFTFDRRGMTLRLRKRVFNERRPMIVDLISGLALPLPEHFYDVPLSAAGEGEGGDVSFDFGLSDDKPDLADQMCLGADDQLVISAPDMVTETVGILARKGSGKTYLGMVMAEEFLTSPHNLQFVVLDPTGAWWGLGISEDGENPVAKNVVVFGGEHGHFRLRHDDGTKLARLVVDLAPLPMILDLSKFSNEEQHEFGADFATELYRRNREPIHLFIDEADAFAPQKLDRGSPHHRRSLGAMSTLIRRGRLRSIGATMITQRPAVISKDVLSQIGVMFFLYATAPHDKAAIGLWLQGNVSPEVTRSCLNDLSGLGKGVAYFFQTGENSRFCKFKVRTKKSYDSSLQKHPKHPRKVVARMGLPASLVQKIVESMEKVSSWVDEEELEEPGTDLVVAFSSETDRTAEEREDRVMANLASRNGGEVADEQAGTDDFEAGQESGGDEDDLDFEARDTEAFEES
jgi:hypothetical protein